jgi:hypothetical protein
MTSHDRKSLIMPCVFHAIVAFLVITVLCRCPALTEYEFNSSAIEHANSSMQPSKNWGRPADLLANQTV